MSPIPHLTSRMLARSRQGASAACAVATLGLLVAGFVAAASPATAANASIGLGTAADYAVLAGSTVTNTGPSVLSGDLGLSPGNAVSGFPPGTVAGTMHVADAAAGQAQVDLTTAYNDAAGRASTATISQDLAGQTLTAGVYTAATSMGLSGTLTLDGQGNPAAVFVFQAGSTLTTGSGSRVALVNGASPCNVFWQVGSSATLGTSTQFVGTVMALTSASLTTNATVQGRVLARNGAVTLDSNVITSPGCAIPPTSPGTSGPTATGEATTPAGSSTGTHHSSTQQTTSTPVIPTGHPSTGVGDARSSGATSRSRSGALFVLAGLAGAAALAAALLASRPVTMRRRG
jgi:hypothetical protein